MIHIFISVKIRKGSTNNLNFIDLLNDLIAKNKYKLVKSLKVWNHIATSFEEEHAHPSSTINYVGSYQ